MVLLKDFITTHITYVLLPSIKCRTHFYIILYWKYDILLKVVVHLTLNFKTKLGLLEQKFCCNLAKETCSQSNKLYSRIV